MTTLTGRDTRTALRRAAGRAGLAPSIHNSQPWQLTLAGDQLELRLDTSRRLSYVDPDGRQAIISCGCALLNARVSLASEPAGGSEVVRFPNGFADPLLARIHYVANGTEDPVARGARLNLEELDFAIAVRRTNRTRFEEMAVPERFVDKLAAAAAAEGTVLFSVQREPHREAIAELTRRADAAQYSDPGYRAELRAWTTDDASRRDGVHTRSVPRVDAASHDDVPLRDFDMRGNGGLSARTGSTRTQTMLLLGTDSDTPLDWLRAGEALEHVLLTAALAGWESSPVMQALEVPSTRAELRSALGVRFFPQFLVRIGRGHPVPSTARRPVEEFLDER